MNRNEYHVSVMLKECIEGLDVQPQGHYVDVTFGGGGHSRAILSYLETGGRLYGFDQDADAVQNVPSHPCFTFVRSNFRYLKQWMEFYGEDGVDGILADLGVSAHHFDDAERGFSLRAEGPLDMRMNRQAKRTAAEIVNTYEERELTKLFDCYGELKPAHTLAKAICRERMLNGPILTTEVLQKCLAKHLNPAREKKEMAKVFQALRIEVNGELDALNEMLQAAGQCLKPGGRLVVLSYHSLEDRMVKNYIRSGNGEGVIEKDFYGQILAPLKALKGYPLAPTQEEQQANPRSRSAKLRVAEKVVE